MSIGSPLGLLLAWELAARFGWIDIRFFPAPSTIIGVMFRMAQSGELARPRPDQHAAHLRSASCSAACRR